MKFASWAITSVTALGLVGFSCGCSSEGSQDSDNAAQTSGEVEAVADEQWAAYEPKIETREDGREIQKTPYASGGTLGAGYGYAADWKYYNTYVLNADERGCNSCHDLETVMKTRVNEGKHPTFLSVYGNEKIPYENCIACHSAYNVDIQDAMHGHMSSDSFTAMGGTCLSCHDINDEGDYVMWDDVKYDVLKGITDVDASSVDVDIDWNQDEVSDTSQMFLKQMADQDYAFDIVDHGDDILNTWTVSFTGEVGVPRTMTIQEMIDEFGTETRKQAYQCTINGQGGGYIYQAEVTGIPLKRIVESLDLTDQALVIDPIGADGYTQPITLEAALENDALLVYRMNGEELPDSQGYPLSIWFKGPSAGNDTRYLSEINFSAEGSTPPAGSNGFQQGVFGDYVYPATGEYINTPNIGVLTVESGQIFPAGEPVHIEGFAHAFDETVTKIEFSFDHGATWIDVPTENTDNTKWVYWKMDVNSFVEPGSYLLEMRATSVDADGMEHTNAVQPKCLINIR